MSLPRTFVGFSSTDITRYWLMRAWKAHENIDFDFCDCQLKDELYSEDEEYIKRKCRDRIRMAGTYIMLIGTGTKSKHKYVKWEAEVAIEKDCRIIGVNLDKWRFQNPATCPPVINDVGAIFVPFSPQIIQHALENFKRKVSQNWVYKDETYTQQGYVLTGNCAERPPKPTLGELFRQDLPSSKLRIGELLGEDRTPPKLGLGELFGKDQPTSGLREMLRKFNLGKE